MLPKTIYIDMSINLLASINTSQQLLESPIIQCTR